MSAHRLSLGYRTLERMIQIADDADGQTNALMLYADRYDDNGLHLAIDYQEGALRDDLILVLCCYIAHKDLKTLRRVSVVDVLFMRHSMLCAFI